MRSHRVHRRYEADATGLDPVEESRHVMTLTTHGSKADSLYATY